MAAYIFFFSLSKCLDDAQSFLGCVLLTKPYPCFLSSACAHSPQGRYMMNRRQF